MTSKGHISKTLHFLYGHVDISLKSDGRAIDGHERQVVTIIVEDLSVCHQKGTKDKLIGGERGLAQASSAW